jgi:hypothetical protein
MSGKDYVVLLASIMHLTWGLLVLIEPTIQSITGISGIKIGNPVLSGCVLIFAGAIAPLGIYTNTFFSSLLLIPQQILLIVSSVSAIESMILGIYPDGYVPEISPNLFIIADQSPIVWLAILHFSSLFGDIFNGRRTVLASRDAGISKAGS